MKDPNKKRLRKVVKARRKRSNKIRAKRQHELSLNRKLKEIGIDGRFKRNIKFK